MQDIKLKKKKKSKTYKTTVALTTEQELHTNSGLTFIHHTSSEGAAPQQKFVDTDGHNTIETKKQQNEHMLTTPMEGTEGNRLVSTETEAAPWPATY